MRSLVSSWFRWINKICNILETELGLPQDEILYQHLVSPRGHAVFCLGTALVIGRESIGKGKVGCEAVKPQFSQDTVQAVAEFNKANEIKCFI